MIPEFANWFALKQQADDAGGSEASSVLSGFENELTNRPDDPLSIADFIDALEEIDDLKKKRQLAFTVVFQRALWLAYLQLLKVTDNMIDALQGSEEVDLDELVDEEDEDDVHGVESSESDSESRQLRRAREFVDALNHVLSKEPEFLRIDYEFSWDDAPERFDRFWLGSLQQPGGAIDFTQAASKRGSDLLVLLGLLWIYRQSSDLTADDFDVFLERVDDDPNGVDLKCMQCLRRMYDGELTIAGRILTSRDNKLTDDSLWGEIRGRAAWLWRILTSD